MSLFFITLLVFGMVISLMSIGVIVGDIRIKGSCGGADGCDLCFFKDRKECRKEESRDRDKEPANDEPGASIKTCPETNIPKHPGTED